jgi:hypothetical protein
MRYVIKSRDHFLCHNNNAIPTVIEARASTGFALYVTS